MKNQRSREKSFEKIIQYLNTIIEKTRVLASGLRPSSLEVLGLRPALKGLVNDFRCNKDLRVRFSCGRLDHLVFKAEEINVYRVIQEALTNIVRHAGARHAVIAIKKIKNHLRILIRDDGQGAKCNTRRIKGPQGLGLSTMEERVRLLGGKWEFSSVKGKGTRIVLTIPVDVHKKHG
ncbi:MAG TPA: hypothetical protein DD723_09260 [Candidatus Omnitrophica bacterium]|nr:hypothetical protein [Candidatus Omnitrophota bacterium]